MKQIAGIANGATGTMSECSRRIFYMDMRNQCVVGIDLVTGARKIYCPVSTNESCSIVGVHTIDYDHFVFIDVVSGNDALLDSIKLPD